MLELYHYGFSTCSQKVRLGLADACVLPYVLRLDHLAMTPLVCSAARPSLARWHEGVRARPSFEVAVANWAPEPAVAMLRENGKAVWPQVEAMAGRA